MWEVTELLFSALSFRTIEFQVTAIHTHENFYCETSINVNTTITSHSWYRMKGLCLTHGAIALGAGFGLNFRIFSAQTSHMHLTMIHLLTKIILTGIQARVPSARSESSGSGFVWLIGLWRSTEPFICVTSGNTFNDLICPHKECK